MTDTLSILRVAQSTYPEVVGGVGIHVSSMSKMQAEMGHDVTVITSDHGNKDLPQKEERDGYRILRVSEIIDPIDNSITPSILQTIRKELPKHDILHIHSHLYFMSNIAAIVGRFFDTPICVTNHGLGSDTAPKILLKLFNPTIGKVTFNSADCIFCYTETDKKRLLDWGVNSNIKIIHNGIDTNRFSPNKKSKNSNQILFVGRLKENKGPHILLNAFAKLQTKFPEYKLKFVGDGPMMNQLKMIVDDLGISNKVEFTGMVPNSDLPPYYRESRVFVLPSYSEGLPRTVLEAMSCETPVVTSSLPQLEPVVDGAGMLFETGEVLDLYESLVELLSKQDMLSEMGGCGRKKVVNNYSWEETIRKTTKAYYQLL